MKCYNKLSLCDGVKGTEGQLKYLDPLIYSTIYYPQYTTCMLQLRRTNLGLSEYLQAGHQLHPNVG